MSDSDDAFARTRALFALPEGVIYLDGNSLGPMPKAAAARLERTAREEWAGLLIRGWNDAGWIDLPGRVGARIAALIGAEADSVRAADSTTVNLFKCLSAALAMRPDRRVIVSEAGNFPTDLYAAQRLAEALGRGHELRLVEGDDIEAALGPDVAVVMLTEVDYRSGRRLDMRALTAAAQEAGALTIWDLAHSAGAIPVDLAGAGADFAVGCGYKYLNGGPGAPAFLYVRPNLQSEAAPTLAGWMGHAAPFAFDPGYAPAEGIDRMLTGTPGVLAMSALETALEVWEGVDMQAVRVRSIALSEAFRAAVEEACPELELASPRDPERRGSQISFRHPQGYAVMQALIARGVIGDFRAPDLIRFGFAPLYNTMAEIEAAAAHLADILASRAWDRPEFHARAKVT